MSSLQELLHRSHIGQPLWLTYVRSEFEKMQETESVILCLDSFDQVRRDFRLALPRWDNKEERRFVYEYLCAEVFNTLCACGGWRITFFVDPEPNPAMDLLNNLKESFQLSHSLRAGLGKAINVANRMSRAFSEKEFSFTICDISKYKPNNPLLSLTGSPASALRSLCRETEQKCCVGIDVGGTDIKLAASCQGRLVAVKEYDWNPASFAGIDQIISPILLLARLMRACIASEGREDTALLYALRKDASDTEIAAAVEAVEASVNTDVLDAIGVSFPDIVLHNRIVGGETPKTASVRRCSGPGYEEEFAKLSALQELLLTLCRAGGHCTLANDGNMAAFTAAMELSCGKEPELIEGGVVAHSLGTDLGTGWLDAQGRIPQLPLELYDLWMDLGSAPAARLSPEDLRSNRSENSSLPGVRRCLGQSAAFRLAWELDPELLAGYTEERDGILRICTEPEDLRKPCLEHLIRMAESGDSAAGEIFRQIGRNLAVVSHEMNHLLQPNAKRRFLFGRFVKSSCCFALLQEGFSDIAPELRLVNAGENLANTSLMRQLSNREDVTVAQFAQAVGALYYSLSSGTEK